MANNLNNNSPPGLDNNHPRLLMTHSSTIPSSFQRRTADGARHFRDNISNVIREIQPFVDNARNANAISISSFLSRPQETNVTQHQNGANLDNSFIINLDENVVEAEPRNDQLQHAEEPHIANNNNPDDPNNRNQPILEAQILLENVLKYLPFMLILLVKSVYDYHESIFVLIILFTTFAHTNSAVKKETTKRHKRSLGTLGIELLYIFVCCVFLHFVYEDELNNLNSVLNLVLVRTFTHPLTVGNLLWIVTITDFALKLITVSLKILLTMLPDQIVPFQKRGKMYLFIEAVSQMYRSVATIHPWLNYLLESYQGSEKIIAVFLSAFYMISKGTDLMSRLKLLRTSFFKLLQNVTVGSSPSKEQIQTAGEHCPICHDEYDSPVLLHCRHIFCESCVTTWFDREQTCPLCRAKIVDDPSWRDGSTSYFIQLY